MILLADGDIGGVPADFVKYFIMMLMALGGMWLAHRKGMQASGTKADPLSIAQPLDVRTVKDPAIKEETWDELRRLDENIVSITRENLRQHEATAKRINEVIHAGEGRAATILGALHAMETRMTEATLKEIKDIHVRLNPLAERVQGHREAIKRIDSRCAELWEWICKIFDQINLGKKK